MIGGLSSKYLQQVLCRAVEDTFSGKTRQSILKLRLSDTLGIESADRVNKELIWCWERAEFWSRKMKKHRHSLSLWRSPLLWAVMSDPGEEFGTWRVIGAPWWSLIPILHRRRAAPGSRGHNHSVASQSCGAQGEQKIETQLILIIVKP